MRTITAISCVMLAAVGGGAYADTTSSAELAAIEKALPAGWTMIETDAELVFRHDRPCYRGTERLPNEPPEQVVKKVGGKGSKADGALVTLELRYRLEAKWTPAQYAAARATNAAVATEVKAARELYKIDGIKVAKGTFLPANADERARLAAFEKAEGAANAKLEREPLCTLGDTAIFDGDETYAPLKLEIDPPEAAREAYTIVALVKQRCGVK